MSYDAVAFVLRLAAAIVWTGVLVLILSGHWHTTLLRRSLVCASVVGLLWTLVYGGAVGIGIVPGDAARVIYTAVATAILIVGIVLLLTADGS